MGQNGKKKSNLGSEIIKAFLEGVYNGDMSSLRTAISDTADSVIDETKKTIREAAIQHPKNLSSHQESYSSGEYTRQRQEKLYKEREERIKQAQRAREAQSREKANQPVTRKKGTTALGFPMERVGEVSSILKIVGGSAGTAICGLSVIKAIPAMIAGTASLGGLIAAGVFAAGFIVLINLGLGSRKRLALADRYISLMQNKDYVEVSYLSESTGQSVKKVQRDIRKMLRAGFFPQGHLDSDGKYFILTDSTFNQYLETKKKQIEDSTVDTTARVVGEYEGLSEEESAELDQMVREGEDYITKLHDLNDLIPGEIITEKLNKLELLLTDIFTNIKRHPEQMPKMHELMEYYLPTMIKLVSAYQEYDAITDPGDSIQKAKKDIEDTLDSINDAFKKLLNKLFRDSVLDVTSDAKVLKTLFAQNGLYEEKGEGNE